MFGATRRAVLALLFGHPEESYYLRQVVRLTGLGLGTVQRELNHLCAAGIIRRTARGHQVYFQANEQNPIFPELKGLILKTAGVGDTLRAALLPLGPKIRSAFIYGSFARNEDRPGSDVDLLVIGEVGFEEVISALQGAQQSLAREVNPTVYPLREFRSKLRAKHHFLTTVMHAPKLFLIGDDLELARLGSE